MATDFPLRIEGLRVSSCCSWPTVLAQSMDGGFVRQNCTKCGRPHLLSKHEFFDRLRCAVDCPHCGDRMLKVYVGNNYGFQCPTCHGTLLLADIVPWYYDLAPLKTERVMASAMVQ